MAKKNVSQQGQNVLRSTQATSTTSMSDDEGTPWFLKVLAILCLIALFIFLVVMSQSDKTNVASPVNGDSLGPTTGQDLDSYRDAAESSLSYLKDEGLETYHWGVVYLQEPQPAQEVIDTVIRPVENAFPDDFIRVSTVIFNSGQQIAIWQENGSASWEDQFRTAIVKNQNFTQKDDETISGLLLYAPYDVFERIAAGDIDGMGTNIFSVEILPADAQSGRFGVQPVSGKS